MERRTILLWVNIALIILIVISGIYLAISIMQGPPPANIPQNVSFNVRYISPTQMKVEFNNFSNPILFSDVWIKTVSPLGDVCTADVHGDVLVYEQEPEDANDPKSLANITISSTGTLQKGSYFIMSNYRDLTKGPWLFEMVHRATKTIVSKGSIIVPDTDTAPTGSISAVMDVSESEVKLMLGTISPSTELSYCYVEVLGPDMTVHTMYLNDTSSMIMLLIDDTQVKMVDADGNGLMNSGDYIDLRKWTGALAEGQWSVEISYVFTGDIIAYAYFPI